MPSAYLGLGANLGDRAATLAAAVRGLAAPDVAVAAVSSVYETAPVGGGPQPDFLNLACRVETTLAPAALLARCLALEAALGRVRRERWGPRVIDLDLLLHGDTVQADAGLTLPHPRMLGRAFVLVPLAEIAPDVVVAGATVAEWAARVGADGVRRVGPLRS